MARLFWCAAARNLFTGTLCCGWHAAHTMPRTLMTTEVWSPNRHPAHTARALSASGSTGVVILRAGSGDIHDTSCDVRH
jgi:hypothetical protein